MSYHNINTSNLQNQSQSEILTYINGAPLFRTIQQALNYGQTVGLPGYHTHMFQNVIGYMAGFDHSQATANQQQAFLENLELESEKEISLFEINTQDLSTSETNRQLKINGSVNSEFYIQVVQNSASTSVLDKFYNFTTRTFESNFNKNHILNVKLKSNSYSKNIIFPSTTVTDYTVILAVKENSNTIISNTVSTSKHVASKKINQTAPVQVDFVFKTANTSSYSANPPHANVTSTGTPGLVTDTRVDIEKTVTNASTDANGFGLIVGNGFSDERSFFIEQNQTVNGAITSSNSFLLDDVSNITVDSVITAVDGGSLSGTPHVVSIVENLVTISSAQTFADNRVLTFKTTGNSKIELATGLKFNTAFLATTLRDIVQHTAKSKVTNKLDISTQFVRTSARADGSITEATDSASQTVVTLNGTYGIAGADKTVISGLNVPINSTTVSTINTASSSAGKITLNQALTEALEGEQQLDFIGSSQSVTFTNAEIVIQSYPSAALTVNLDLDTFITPGTDS
tara:strand:+ start:2721 stop:4268 length:1548 start_codon:yes stop_codon:yes gene_type:complete